MLQNYRVTAFTVFELLVENQLGVKLPPSQIRVNTSKTIKRHNVDFLHVGADLLKLQVDDVIFGGGGQECPKRVLKL